MRSRTETIAVLILVISIVRGLSANESSEVDKSSCLADATRAAIVRSLPLLEKGTQGSAEQRKCFTCHNQALPMLTLVEARKRGFAINEDNFTRQLDHTVAHLKRGQKKYLDGEGQGGKVVTAGYALWALDVGGWIPDETTAAVTGYLLKYQQDASHWTHLSSRPPSTGSEFMTTFVALRGLQKFGTQQQQVEIEARKKQVRQWVLAEKPAELEDHVFRLWTLPYMDVDQETLGAQTAELVGQQREDGGWAQKSEMNSDAYATGTSLVVLLEVAGLPVEHSAVQRGIKYLLDAQQKDGSWQVVSRAKPFQTYYETGFPHGKDQFISISASSWATLALLLTLAP